LSEHQEGGEAVKASSPSSSFSPGFPGLFAPSHPVQQLSTSKRSIPAGQIETPLLLGAEESIRR
jgi:hypothetical protein